MPASAIILILISTFLHAGWNLILRSQRAIYVAWRINLIVVAIGLGPALVAEFLGTRFPGQVWGYLVVAGIFQALYYFGLVKGYQNGDFSVVYPVARALPILLVALADVVQGHAPSPVAWLGMLLVTAGCLVIPLESMRSFEIGRYWNLTMVWIFATALGTVGYTIADNAAAAVIQPGPLAAARYGIFEFLFTILFYWPILKSTRQPIHGPKGWAGWKWPVLGAIGVFGAYWLILWSYQISPQASYVVALRQFSIVIGVVMGTFLFREPAPGLRIGAALAIAAGIACIALAG